MPTSKIGEQGKSIINGRSSPRVTMRKVKPIELDFESISKSTEDLHINSKTPDAKIIHLKDMQTVKTTNGGIIQFSLPKNVASEQYRFLHHPELSSGQRFKLWNIARMYDVKPLRDAKRRSYEEQKDRSFKENELKKKMLFDIEERQGLHLKQNSSLPSRALSAQTTGHRRAQTTPRTRRPWTSPPRISTNQKNRQRESMKKFKDRLEFARSNNFRQNTSMAGAETKRREAKNLTYDDDDLSYMLSSEGRNRSVASRYRSDSSSQRSRVGSLRSRASTYLPKDRKSSYRNRSHTTKETVRSAGNDDDTVSQNLDVLTEYRAPDAPWASADAISIAESMSLGGDRILSHFADTLSLGGDRVIGNPDSTSLAGDIYGDNTSTNELVVRVEETDLTLANANNNTDNVADSNKVESPRIESNKEGDNVSIGTPSIAESISEEHKKTTLGFATEEETIFEEGVSEFDIRKRRGQTISENHARNADTASLGGRMKSGSFSAGLKSAHSSTSLSSEDSLHKAMKASADDPGDMFFTNRPEAKAGDGFWSKMAQEKDTFSVFGNTTTFT